MPTFAQRLQIATCWLLSHVRGAPQPEHYPIAVRRQQGAPADASWVAQVLNWPGPCGLGASAAQARASLLAELRQIAVARASQGQAMPRPGTGLPIELASAERVERDAALLDGFIVHALGFDPADPVFISDLSALEDFGDDAELAQIRQRIRQHYGLSLAPGDSTRVVDILDRIAARSRGA